MYPFKDGETYPRNQWCIAAWSHEVGRELLERKILGVSVVMFRTEAGEAVRSTIAARIAPIRCPRGGSSRTSCNAPIMASNLIAPADA